MRRPPNFWSAPARVRARWSALLLIVLPLAASVPACGVVESAPTPHLVPGGGIGDGAIAGLLNVYVKAERQRHPDTAREREQRRLRRRT